MNARLRRGGPALRWILSATLGIVGAAALLVAVRTQVTSLRYELRDDRRQQLVLREEVEQLRVATEVLGSAERLEPRALALGLIFPQPGQVIALSAGGPPDSAVAAAPAGAAP